MTNTQSSPPGQGRRFDYGQDTAAVGANGEALPARNSIFDDRPQIPYVIPIMVFVLCMAPRAFGHFLGIHWARLWFNYTPLVYTVQTLAATLTLVLLWRFYTPIKWSHLWLGAAVGLFGLLQWVGMEYAVQYFWHFVLHGQTLHYPRIFGGQNAKNYDPIKEIPNLWARISFYIVRIGGPTLMVPVMEELFWRDFIWRALIRGARFQEVPVGQASVVALVGSSLLFATGHFQWPSAIVYGLMIGWLLIRTKSLGSCIVAHAVTNFSLGIYVLMTHQWQFW